MDSTFSSSQLMCTLTGPDLALRKSKVQQELFSQVKSVEELENGYAFIFTDNNQLLLKLVDYMLAEKKCCPFFQQTLTIGPEGQEVRWELAGQEGVKEMLKELFDLPSSDKKSEN